MYDLKRTALYDENGRKKEPVQIKVGDVDIGKDFCVIAGPCSIESEEQILYIAREVKKAGANILRGGAYKPRTSPYSFQGLGKIGLSYLARAGKSVGLPVITEVVDTRDVELVCEYTDILQIGTRNMQNYSLLVEVGKTNKPVLLKRGINSTLEEWLNCAEYIMSSGNEQVILCERGIRTYETYTRNTLDLSSVVAIHELSNLPIFVDPSHATGKRKMVKPMSLAAIMAGCQGLEIEVHPSPNTALSDGEQQLTISQFDDLMNDIRKTLALRSTIEY